MRVLTWNLFHGRAVPPAGRDLQDEFVAALAGWDWDVALLQEVPPWWPPALARACGADERTALTARNGLLALRRFVAQRAPDLVKSNGGGANAILVRPTAGRITAHRSAVLRRCPERRVCHAVALSGGVWAANVHAQVHSERRAQADIARAAAATLTWAGDAPALLGGDLNVRAPVAPGFRHLGGDGVDHILGRAFDVAGAPAQPDRGRLSDHAPVVVCVVAETGNTSG
jgi:endonuclease/exonuclease/phosphatase family metal-dependent hydrolase